MAGGNGFGTGDAGERSRSRNGEKERRTDDDKAVEKKNTGNNNSMGTAVLVFVPWLLFSLTGVMFALAYHHFYYVVWCMILLFTLIASTFLILHSQGRMGGSWFKYLGVCCLIAIFVGTFSGLYNYWTHMYLYWSYDEAAVYSNVLPTEPAEARSDAGKIIFSSSARVDTTRAVGFKEGTAYCVAPILDNTQLGRVKVEYWAAGTDCCTARGDFACDDTWNPQAHSGLVVLNTAAGGQGVSTRGRVSSGEGTDMMLGTPVADYYFDAVRLAEASFDVTSAEHPVFVRWVLDPHQIQQDYWRLGVGWGVATVCVYLLFALVSGIMLQLLSKRSAANQGARIGD